MKTKSLLHKLLIFWLITSIHFYCLLGQSQERLNEKIHTLIKEQKLSGAVWTVVNRQGEIKKDACGYKNMTTKEKLDSTNKILVGSIAKTIIATGFLRMATMGIINLDDPIRKFLPNIPIQNKWEDTHPVTIRYLLDHTSGLSDVKLWQVFSTTARPDTPLGYAYNQSPSLLIVQAKPGTIHSYSNIGYNILGEIAEVISKKSFEQYFHELLLLPLEMKNSSFHFISQKEDKQLAMGHFDDGQPVFAKPMYLRAAGQFLTTANDMGKFLTFMMSDGKINGKQFIHKELLNEVGNNITTDSYKNGVPLGEALGAYKRDRYGVMGIAKNGNTLGFRSMLYMFPHHQKAFFIAFNMDSETSQYDLFNEILTKHLDLPIERFKEKGYIIDEKKKLWEGYYVPLITKVKPFRLLDIVFNFIKVTFSKNEATLSPFQGKSKKLLYQQNNLFSMKDRIDVSHSFYKVSESDYFITDGINTYQKISGIKILAIGASFGLGAISILYFIIIGVFGAIKIKSKFFSSPEFPIIIVLILLMFAIFSIGTQSILKLGDFSLSNFVIALSTTLLPVSSIITCTLLIKMHEKFFQKFSFWASALVFQLCLLLVTNDLIPLILWK